VFTKGFNDFRSTNRSCSHPGFDSQGGTDLFARFMEQALYHPVMDITAGGARSDARRIISRA